MTLNPDIEKAHSFAKACHRKQLRKYSGTPYIEHPVAVARIVNSLGYDDHVVIAALLHDVVEDCGITLEEITNLFGEKVSRLVEMVTDVSKPSDGNREVRKELDRQHIAKADHEGQTIKLADLIHNTMSIAVKDKKFAKIYLEEKKRLLSVLGKGNNVLFVMASIMVKEVSE